MMTVDRIGVFLMASNLGILLCLGCSERGTPRICCVKWRRGGRGRWGGRGEAGRWRGRRTRRQPHAAYQSSLATTTHWKLLRIHWDDCEDQTERHAARTKGVCFGSLFISSTSLQLFHSFESLVWYSFSLWIASSGSPLPESRDTFAHRCLSTVKIVWSPCCVGAKILPGSRYLSDWRAPPPCSAVGVGWEVGLCPPSAVSRPSNPPDGPTGSSLHWHWYNITSSLNQHNAMLMLRVSWTLWLLLTEAVQPFNFCQRKKLSCRVQRFSLWWRCAGCNQQIKP